MLQAPTDNLYKFLAIFGLIMFGFSIYVPLQRLEAYGISNTNLETAYEPLFEKLSIIDDASRTKLQCAINQTERGTTNKANSHGACIELMNAMEKSEKAREDLISLRSKINQLEHERSFFYKQYYFYLCLGVVAGCIGLILCVAGFWLWYIRLQRFLDAAAQKEAGSTESQTDIRSSTTSQQDKPVSTA